MVASKEPASFRDPGGFVFRGEDESLYRQVNRVNGDSYSALIESGLYDRLVSRGQLIEHEEVSTEKALTDDAQFVIHPRELPFISYPYEWSFSGLKQAALLTLDIQRQALATGMTLKDASAFNVQFEGARAVFIDTLSFERHADGEPWYAYGQFCRHFLAPLALMARRDIGLGRLLTSHIDGLPLELTARLLPWSTCLSPGMAMHLHLQALMVKRYSRTSGKRPKTNRRVSLPGLIALIDSLESAIDRLEWRGSSHWADYESDHAYDDRGVEQKRLAVTEFLGRTGPRSVWDLGANTGIFSRIARATGATTYAFDCDPACVDIHFRRCMTDGCRSVLPLLVDLANPSPAIGWAHHERKALAERGPADVVMALALIHHLAITHNLPLPKIADYLARLGEYLIVEFVPKHDPQVQRLLQSRRDVFCDYHTAAFDRAFQERFQLVASRTIGETGRVVHLMRKR